MREKCSAHSGFESQINNVGKWQDIHIEVEHKKIWEAIDSFKNRLPVWATFSFSMLTFLIGCLFTALQLK